MEEPTQKSKVAIIVPTLNRPDFVIRQLNYYARLHSPHTIYYADSSNPENAKKVTDEIAKLKARLHIVYMPSPVGDPTKSMLQLLSSVQEKYVAYAGDDDYWVPDALNQCVEFLEKNPDYEAATGKSVMFRLENNGVYGKIKVIYDYPKYPIEDDTASERLFNYLGPKPSTIAAAVVRTEHFLKYQRDSMEIKDFSIQAEFLISCLMPIAGKYKVIDKLGYVMQLHNIDIHAQITSKDTFEWVINNENWYSSYTLLKAKVVAALMAKDNISQEKAEQVFKQSMWFWMKERLRTSYRHINIINQPIKKSLRLKIATCLPLLKKAYNKFIVPWLNKEQLQYEVTRPNSKYYKDFKAVVDSLTEIRAA